MSDRLSKKQRSQLMRRVRTAGTDIEKELLGIVHEFWMTDRYRKNPKDILGKPDIFFSRKKLVIFADGDFWHGKGFKKWKKGLPEFWLNKITANIERDRKQTRKLKKNGYNVLRFWGSEIKCESEKITEIIKQALK